jgi:UDP-N-acetylglucosamine:LPS N-acetylglucosamine transferase
VAAADVVVAPPEHGLSQQILAQGRPWIVLPGSRRHRQQRHLARALARAGAACYMPAWPSTPFGWDRAIEQVRHIAADAQQALVQGPGARDAALWLDRLATALWQQAPLQEAAE